MAEVQQQEGRREGDNGQLGGEASPSRHSDYHGVPLPSPERPAGRLAEAPGGGGGKMASAGVQTGAPPPLAAMIGLCWKISMPIQLLSCCRLASLESRCRLPACLRCALLAEAATPALRTEQRAALSSAASTPRGTPGAPLAGPLDY